MTLHAITPTYPPQPTPCPDCQHPGPHILLDARFVECANRFVECGNQWLPCGRSWELPTPVNPADDATERVITLLDTCEDLAVVDTNDGRLLLTWDTTLDLARRIAEDSELRARITGSAELGGVA